MLNLDLKVNSRLEVIIGEKAYRALIMDIEDDFLKMNVPVCDGDYLILHSGEKININTYLGEYGCFNFWCEVISRGKEGSIIYYKISKPFNIIKIQRRNSFRVGVLTPIEYKKITNIDEDDIENIPYKEGLMVDLSAGGLKIKINEEITKQDLILVKLKLNKIQLEVKCNIVRIENTLGKENLCGLRFIDITPAQGEKIIQELFEIIRKQRAKS